MKQMEKNSLYEDISKCCGCFACKDACPKDAITIKTTEAGFLYPEIDTAKCVSCGLCIRICGYKKGNDGNKPEKVFAAASKNNAIVMAAASGGIFSVMAREFVNSGGVVCGSAMFRTEAGFIVKHSFADNENELKKLAGSKYVESATDGVFRKAEEILRSGKSLLFSGTPCQVAALKSFLRKDYENLITVDLICHGVPSLRLFNDYISFYEEKHSCTVMDFIFRDKSRGQGMNCRITENNGERTRIKVMDGRLSSYFGMFLKGSVYRENCYSCPYASEKRVSDITLGDYWGVYQEHAGEVSKAGLDNRKGISCVLINTGKGEDIWKTTGEDILCFQSEFEKVAAHNDRLLTPSSKTDDREYVMRSYIRSGYKSVDEKYRREIRIKKIRYILAFHTPKAIKRNLKRFLSSLAGVWMRPDRKRCN